MARKSGTYVLRPQKRSAAQKKQVVKDTARHNAAVQRRNAKLHANAIARRNAAKYPRDPGARAQLSKPARKKAERTAKRWNNGTTEKYEQGQRNKAVAQLLTGKKRLKFGKETATAAVPKKLDIRDLTTTNRYNKGIKWSNVHESSSQAFLHRLDEAYAAGDKAAKSVGPGIRTVLKNVPTLKLSPQKAMHNKAGSVTIRKSTQKEANEQVRAGKKLLKAPLKVTGAAAKGAGAVGKEGVKQVRIAKSKAEKPVKGLPGGKTAIKAAGVASLPIKAPLKAVGAGGKAAWNSDEVIKAAIAGKSPKKIVKASQGKEKTSGQSIAKSLGVDPKEHKGANILVGGAVDLGAQAPLAAFTGGEGTAAKMAARKAAQDVLRSETKKALAEAGGRKAGFKTLGDLPKATQARIEAKQAQAAEEAHAKGSIKTGHHRDIHVGVDFRVPFGRGRRVSHLVPVTRPVTKGRVKLSHKLDAKELKEAERAKQAAKDGKQVKGPLKKLRREPIKTLRDIPNNMNVAVNVNANDRHVSEFEALRGNTAAAKKRAIDAEIERDANNLYESFTKALDKDVDPRTAVVRLNAEMEKLGPRADSATVRHLHAVSEKAHNELVKRGQAHAWGGQRLRTWDRENSMNTKGARLTLTRSNKKVEAARADRRLAAASEKGTASDTTLGKPGKKIYEKRAPKTLQEKTDVHALAHAHPEIGAQMMKVEDVLPFREHKWTEANSKGQRNYASLKADIEKNGIKEPLILEYGEEGRHAYLGEGNTRLAIAKELGIKEVPVKVIRTRDVRKRTGARPVPGKDPDEFGYLPSNMRPTDIGLKGREAKHPKKAAGRKPRSVDHPLAMKSQARERKARQRHKSADLHDRRTEEARATLHKITTRLLTLGGHGDEAVKAQNKLEIGRNKISSTGTAVKRNEYGAESYVKKRSDVDKRIAKQEKKVHGLGGEVGEKRRQFEKTGAANERAGVRFTQTGSSYEKGKMRGLRMGNPAAGGKMAKAEGDLAKEQKALDDLYAERSALDAEMKSGRKVVEKSRAKQSGAVEKALDDVDAALTRIAAKGLSKQEEVAELAELRKVALARVGQSKTNAKGMRTLAKAEEKAAVEARREYARSNTAVAQQEVKFQEQNRDKVEELKERFKAEADTEDLAATQNLLKRYEDEALALGDRPLATHFRNLAARKAREPAYWSLRKLKQIDDPIAVPMSQRRDLTRLEPRKARQQTVEEAAAKGDGETYDFSPDGQIKDTKYNRALANESDYWESVAKTYKDQGPTGSWYAVTPLGMSKPVPTAAQALTTVKNVGQGKVVRLTDQTVEQIYRKGELHHTDFTGNLFTANWRKGIGTWKRFAILTPTNYMRNLIGDTMRSIAIGGSGALHTRDAFKLVRAETKRQKWERDPRRFLEDMNLSGHRVSNAELDKMLDKKITIGHGVIRRDVTVREMLDEMATQGIMESGVIRSDVLGASPKANVIHKPGRLDRADRAVSAREMTSRAHLYLNARSAGLTADQSAAVVRKALLDYGDVSEFEEAMRRNLIPFIVFKGRNIATWGGHIVRKPGKLKQYGTIADTAAQLAGYKDYDAFAKDAGEQARQLPIPLPKFFRQFGVNVLNPQIPIGDVYNTYRQVTSTHDIGKAVGQQIFAIRLLNDILPRLSAGKPSTEPSKELAIPDEIGKELMKHPTLIKLFRLSKGANFDGKQAYFGHPAIMDAIGMIPETGALGRVKTGQGAWYLPLINFATGLGASEVKPKTGELQAIRARLRDLDVQINNPTSDANRKLLNKKKKWNKDKRDELYAGQGVKWAQEATGKGGGSATKKKVYVPGKGWQ